MTKLSKQEISDLNSIATAMTLSETERKHLIEEWGKLQVLVKVSDKEKFDKNKTLIQNALNEMESLGKRVKMIEIYMGSLKNRLEEQLNSNKKQLKDISRIKI